MRIRHAEDADTAALATIFISAVDAVASQAYSDEQVRAWRAFAAEPAFADFVRAGETFVAEDDSGAIGFAGLGADGHVASLYVRGDRQRQGVGMALIRHAMVRAAERGIRLLFCEASAFSRPLFEKLGFVVADTEIVVRGGVTFTRFRMRLTVAARP